MRSAGPIANDWSGWSGTLTRCKVVAWRAWFVRLASDGLTAEAIGVPVGKSLLTVQRWRYRSAAKRGWTA